MHTPEQPRNNPMVLVGVFSAVVLFVLGLGAVQDIRVPDPIPGRAVAAPGGALPAEAPGPRPVLRLGDHPLLVKAVSLPATACALPAFGLSDKELIAYYTAGVACMDEAWRPVLEQANLPFERPTLNATPELGGSPCGDAPAEGEAVAYYCGRNRAIYMPTGRMRDNGGGDRPGTHLATLAHEYGHHVQALSGMLRAADFKIGAAGEETPAGLEWSRRIELQANCFAGLFLYATSDALGPDLAREAAEDFQYAVEEPAEKNAHGLPDNQAEWAMNGFAAGTTGSCNTYTASAADVA